MEHATGHLIASSVISLIVPQHSPGALIHTAQVRACFLKKNNISSSFSGQKYGGAGLEPEEIQRVVGLYYTAVKFPTLCLLYSRQSVRQIIKKRGVPPRECSEEPRRAATSSQHSMYM